MLLRDIIEIGDYAGLESNVPHAIQSVADRVRTSVDRAMINRARGEEEGAAALAFLKHVIASDLYKPKRQAEYAEVVMNYGTEEVVNLGRELGRERVQIPRRRTAANGVQAEEKTQGKEEPPSPTRAASPSV